MAIVEVVQKNPTVMGPREHGVSSLHLWGGRGLHHSMGQGRSITGERCSFLLLLFVFFHPDRLEDTTVCDGGQLAKAAGGCLPINTEI